jgi:hypothetical protein
MMHSPALKDLLFSMRQHAGFADLLKAVEQPQLPHYRPSKADTLEQMGARTVFASGQADQHDRWLFLLTGQVPARETEPSQQEKS